MFVLSRLKDAVRVIPELFDKDVTASLTAVLNEKYSGRVLADVGMCVVVHSIIGHTDAMLHPGDGASFCTVEFKLVVFRPYEGELICGRIVESSFEHGVRVSIGFFDQIWVPPGNLRQKAVYDQNERLWTNELEAEGDSYEKEEPERNYLEIDQEVRVSVVCLNFDTTTRAPFAPPETLVPAFLAKQKPKVAADLPMKIIGSFAEDGLGPVEWWGGDADAASRED